MWYLSTAIFTRLKEQKEFVDFFSNNFFSMTIILGFANHLLYNLAEAFPSPPPRGEHTEQQGCQYFLKKKTNYVENSLIQ